MVTTNYRSDKANFEIDNETGRWGVTDPGGQISPDYFSKSIADLSKSDTRPNSIAILVKMSEGCNLACSYCFQKEKPIANMTFESARLLEHNIAQFHSKYPMVKISLEFTGGEPLLNFKVLKGLYDRLNERRIPLAGTGIKTNGTVFSESIYNFFRVNTQVQACFSLDGLTGEGNGARLYKSGLPSYKKVVQNAKVYRSKTQKPLSNIMVLQSAKQVDDAREMLETKLFDSVKINILGHQSPVDQIALANSYLRLMDYAALKSEQGILLRLPTFLEFLRNILRSEERNDWSYCASRTCDAGVNIFAIKNDLSVYPCLESAEDKSSLQGTLTSQSSLTEIYRLNRNGVKLRFNSPLTQILKCKECAVQRFCRGSCGVRSFSAFSKTGMPSDACDYYYSVYTGLIERLADPILRVRLVDYYKKYVSNRTGG